MNDEEVKKNRTLEFLSNFLDRTAFGSKEGRQAKYDESKKNLFGFPLPEFGVSEYLNLPDQSEARQKILDKQKEKLEEEKQKDLGEAVGDTKTTKMLLTESLLREFENRMQNRRDLNFMGQSLPIVDTYAETAIQRALMADKASPTKISQQRLRAQTGEAALMQAIANQASAGAQIGGLGTGRRYGR
tara:strand:+ start:6949 stop:7509 length:561 start_codon:yes stop_codon:yes gene_type:complete